MDRARQLFDAAVVVEPKHGAAWHKWGILEKSQGNYQGARDLWVQVRGACDLWVQVRGARDLWVQVRGARDLWVQVRGARDLWVQVRGARDLWVQVRGVLLVDAGVWGVWGHRIGETGEGWDRSGR